MKPIVEKADVLLEALPYIRRFAGTTFVIKYGGAAMADEELKEGFAEDVALLKFVGINPVIVHGGGPQINQTLDRHGIQTRFVRGIRVTDRATMEVVEMVLGGTVNKDIVSRINRHGGRAVGLTGKDGPLVVARKMEVRVQEGRRPPEILDVGLVGEIVRVNPEIIRALDASNFIPVIAPVGAGEDGETYNINADLVAGKIAEALQAEKLILLSDVEGILDRNDELLPTVSSRDVPRFIQDGVVAGGMIPKLECCVASLRAGVRKAHVIDGRERHAVLLEIFTEKGIGTEVVWERAPS